MLNTMVKMSDEMAREEFLQQAQDAPQMYKTEKQQELYADRWFNLYQKFVGQDQDRIDLFWTEYWDKYINKSVGTVLARFGREVIGN
ncbi:hypothetical protein EDC18_102388 [Natranaerovirga pectinivora]|uniref:TipAS antibiotic-recognition protein n=1 Tax=Natranaerovirga pectinivora TaxID=682400 RepID=A0A4R3MN06_9FIRM|nr:hypothetical protein [Natranaerovirga pectinivora]TCT16369.1 hypothetical protein EDC18_102388 [Natranaerovirga pectinivora]